MNAAPRLVVQVLVREELEKPAEREERRAQLVRRVRDELLARVVELRELDPHPIERPRELTDLVVAAIDDRRAEVARRRSARLPSPAAGADATSIPAAVSPRTSASTSANAVASSSRSRTSRTVASESASGAWKSTTASQPSGTATFA